MANPSASSDQPAPTGTVTFLFTDIEGSTALAQSHPAEWEAARARHHAILQAACDAHDGFVFQIVGDAFCVAFARAADALVAALAAQRALQNPKPQIPNANDSAGHKLPFTIRVRMGIHTCPAEWRNGEYEGYLTLARAQRIMSAGHGGQVLLSLVTAELVRGTLPSEASFRDLGAHLLKSLNQPESLFQLVAPDLPSEFPSLASVQARPNNLPVQLTSFIGREKEIAEIKRLLGTTRLLTLTGSGGTGKTRLSLQVVSEVLDDFRDGVWLVELAPLADPVLVPQTVATVLGIREQPGRVLMDTLGDHLRDKQILIVLDNCEHLLDACAQLADSLLRIAPRLAILASSREALAVAGEQAWRVPSLEVPTADGRRQTADDVRQKQSLGQQTAVSSQSLILMQYAAIQLFVARAAQANAAFRLTEANGVMVAQVCSRLDGIPLAIELAAARVKAMRVEQIAERLDDRFRLLTGGSRTAMPRQQTLRGAIDWSYSLLSESERVLLRRLSVFAGGWTLEAAEAVCGDDVGAHGRAPLPTANVLDLLTHLVDKSLVVLDEQAAEPRYRMLETVRQYAREKLMDSSESDRIRAGHFATYCELGDMLDAQFFGPRQSFWLNRLEGEIGNLRAALEWSLASRHVKTGLRLASALFWLWQQRYTFEGIEVYHQLLSQSDASQHKAEFARACWNEGELRLLHGDTTTAQSNLQTALDTASEIGNDSLMAHAISGLGNVALHQGENDLARERFRDASERFRRLNDTPYLAVTLYSLGGIAHGENDFAQAELLYHEGAALLRSTGEKSALAGTSRRLGMLALLRGDTTSAHESIRESLIINRDIGDKRGVGACIIGFAALALAYGQVETAARLCGAVEKILNDMQTRLLRVDQLEYERLMPVLRSRLSPAALDAAWAAGQALTLEQAITLAMNDSNQVGIPLP